MTKEELEQAKLTYSRLFEERGRQIKSITEIKDLEKDPDVKEYLRLAEESPSVIRYIELTNKLNVNIPTLSHLVNEAFKKITTSEESKIYVYCGAYVNNHKDEKDNYLTIHEDKASYLLYINIESIKDFVKVDPGQKKDFESNNTVLRMGLSINKDEFYEIQMAYFKELLNSEYEDRENIAKKIKKL